MRRVRLKIWQTSQVNLALITTCKMAERCDVRLFFFFQAEDGIRDVAVTGVQTCALPISKPPLREPAPASEDQEFAAEPYVAPASPNDFTPALRTTEGIVPGENGKTRSEERRVGKEWRSRWSPYH